MISRFVWNLLFSNATQVVLVALAWLILTLVFISIRLRNKQISFQKATCKRNKLRKEWFKLWGHKSVRSAQIKQQLDRLKHFQPKSLFTHRQEVMLVIVAVMCLFLAAGSNTGQTWLSNKFTVDGFDSNYASQISIPISSYKLYRLDKNNGHKVRVKSLSYANYARLKAVDHQVIWMRVDNTNRHEVTKIANNMHDLNLTMIKPQAKYRGYSGANAELILSSEEKDD